MEFVLLAVSLGLNLPVSSILVPRLPKVEEEFWGAGRQDTIVLELGLTATYSG